MNMTQQGVIALMKSAITCEKTALPEQFDIEQAYPVLRRHGIMAMGYTGAMQTAMRLQNLSATKGKGALPGEESFAGSQSASSPQKGHCPTGIPC